MATIRSKKSKRPISEPEPIKVNDTVVEKVANWFKDAFNVCGNSSCCGGKNPYYDDKQWEDLNERISYKIKQKNEEQELAK